MGRRPPERHTTHFNLRDALEALGCAICTLVTKAVASSLDGLLYERVNDPGIRQELRASGGFCHRHAWELCDVGDAFGVGLLYQDLLERATTSLKQCLDDRKALAAQQKGTVNQCPSCRQTPEATQRYLSLFVEMFEDPSFRSAIDQSNGLCLPHFQEALSSCRTSAQRTALTNWEQAKLSILLRQLKEFLRKQDYRYIAEGYRTEEAASWLRVVELFVGQRGRKPR